MAEYRREDSEKRYRREIADSLKKSVSRLSGRLRRYMFIQGHGIRLPPIFPEIQQGEN